MGYALFRKDNLGASWGTVRNWVAVKELKLSYYIGLMGDIHIYAYIEFRV